MKKTITLKKNFEFNNVFKNGKFYSGKIIECFYLKNNKKTNYIGIAISSKAYNAVKRNKIKRLIRESYKNVESNLKEGNTFVFLIKKNLNIKDINYNVVKQDIFYIFEKIGLLI